MQSQLVILLMNIAITLLFCAFDKTYKAKFYRLLIVGIGFGLLMVFALPANAQIKSNVKTDINDNYIAIKTKDSSINKPTGKTYTDSKGEVYPVYITANNKLYVIRTSKKTGNQYKQYLKL
jgi:Na+-transporting methylmalonyl-CoA/oxaloacetate decarboxylase beta subunit